MSMTDPIGDMLTRLRNGSAAHHDKVLIPCSSLKIRLAEVLKAQGIIPGIKVDTGAKPLAGFPNETVTEGLDGLRERLRDYHAMGGRFAKWRAVCRRNSSDELFRHT